MPRQIVLDDIVPEDLEWIDPAGKKWSIAGSIDTRQVLTLMKRLQDFGQKGGNHTEELAIILDELKKLFATRHTAEELEQFSVPAYRILPLVLGIMQMLQADIVEGVGALPQTAPGTKRRKK